LSHSDFHEGNIIFLPKDGKYPEFWNNINTVIPEIFRNFAANNEKNILNIVKIIKKRYVSFDWEPGKFSFRICTKGSVSFSKFSNQNVTLQFHVSCLK